MLFFCCTHFFSTLAARKIREFLKYYAGRGGRVDEGARLESVCTPQAYRGFESLSLRRFEY